MLLCWGLAGSSAMIFYLPILVFGLECPPQNVSKQMFFLGLC